MSKIFPWKASPSQKAASPSPSFPSQVGSPDSIPVAPLSTDSKFVASERSYSLSGSKSPVLQPAAYNFARRRSSSGLKWTCGKCQFINSQLNVKCGMCFASPNRGRSMSEATQKLYGLSKVVRPKVSSSLSKPAPCLKEVKVLQQSKMLFGLGHSAERLSCYAACADASLIHNKCSFVMTQTSVDDMLEDLRNPHFVVDQMRKVHESLNQGNDNNEIAYDIARWLALVKLPGLVFVSEHLSEQKDAASSGVFVASFYDSRQENVVQCPIRDWATLLDSQDSDVQNTVIVHTDHTCFVVKPTLLVADSALAESTSRVVHHLRGNVPDDLYSPVNTYLTLVLNSTETFVVDKPIVEQLHSILFAHPQK